MLAGAAAFLPYSFREVHAVSAAPAGVCSMAIPPQQISHHGSCLRHACVCYKDIVCACGRTVAAASMYLVHMCMVQTI
jgi:hypothetical protein